MTTTPQDPSELGSTPSDNAAADTEDMPVPADADTTDGDGDTTELDIGIDVL